MPFSINQLDYLQQLVGFDFSQPTDNGATIIPPDLRRMWHIKGIGVVEKKTISRERNEPTRLATQDLITGLYGLKVPVAFQITSEPGSLAINLGTWLRYKAKAAKDAPAKATLATRKHSIKSLLDSAFTSVEIESDSRVAPIWPMAGLVMGVPTLKPPDTADGALPIDRLIRGLTGSTWSCLVLAEPIKESTTSFLRLCAINELKEVQSETEASKGADPLADYYSQLMSMTLNNLTFGMSLGMWRVGVYLMGDLASYYRLAALWQGIYAGDQSLPVPIRIVTDPVITRMAAGWQLPETEGPPGDGNFQYPLLYQTLLSSDQLAAYIHLPRIETAGFTVSTAPTFDTVTSQQTSQRSINVGTVNAGSRPTQIPYSVNADNLTRHTLVAGVTGTGKTNTVMRLLTEADELEIPFLVIEPAKTEYRALIRHPRVGTRLRVFTLGNENGSPFRMNPFEVLDGTSINTHIDMLRSAFGAGFGMWTPLPQVLEQCLHAIYEDRGWELASDTNNRLATRATPEAFPTLGDLVRKVDELVPRLGYDEKISSDIRASLRTRINGLRAGGKGRMLDVVHSLPMDLLLTGPTVVELEQLGDDDDKAFLISLLLIRLFEYQHRHGRSDTLRHLLVIEEAHRLLGNVSSKSSQEEANPKGKAVETFAHMLSEIREYGQGVIIADQSPVRLAPDAMKNTNLKIAHRTVALEDRVALSGAMAMSEPQTVSLATLERGVAAVFAEGEDAPLLVQVKSIKEDLGKVWPSDDEVRDHMKPLQQPHAAAPVHLGCVADTTTVSACELARVIADSPTFQADLSRLVLSVFQPPDVLIKLWLKMAASMNQYRKAHIDGSTLTHCAIGRASAIYADMRGSSGSWTYESTAEFARRLNDLLTDLSHNITSGNLAAFRKLLTTLATRFYPPYERCNDICAEERVCLYRDAVLSIGKNGRLRQAWEQADAEDIEANEDRSRTWAVALSAAEIIMNREAENGGVTSEFKRAALCYGQLSFLNDGNKTASAREIGLDNLLYESQQK